MENGIGVFGTLIQELHGFFRWEDDQLDFAPLSLTFDLIHHWQCSFARADHQAAAFPRNLLFQRERRVSEGFAELLGSFLLPFPHLASVDQHVIAILNPIDPNLPKWGIYLTPVATICWGCRVWFQVPPTKPL